MFSKSGDKTKLPRRLSDVWIREKSKMAAINRKLIEITYISASIHDSNEITTAIPMFSRSGNTNELLRRMPDVRIGGKSKMAAYNRK